MLNEVVQGLRWLMRSVWRHCGGSGKGREIAWASSRRAIRHPRASLVTTSLCSPVKTIFLDPARVTQDQPALIFSCTFDMGEPTHLTRGNSSSGFSKSAGENRRR